VEHVPAEAREVRLSGAAADRRTVVTAVERARAAAGDRVVSGLSWTDVLRIAHGDGVAPERLLRELRSAGLEAMGAVPIDDEEAATAAIDALLQAGFSQLRLTFGDAPRDRVAVALGAAALQDRFGAIRALSPLSPAAAGFEPSTGFEDVKTVALARIAAPNIMTIQVDWQRYGPKLAQVALTFGADDLDSVPAVDESTHGPRRSLIAEVRRNIEAASFVPAERDGRFNRVE
jgi:aminodeoxyfutalosine synthase